MDIIRREFIYIWYYFSIQMEKDRLGSSAAADSANAVSGWLNTIGLAG